MTMPERFVIVGVNGGFGRVFARKFVNDSSHVTGIDLQELSAEECVQCYVQGDVCHSTDEVRKAIQRADALLFCIPEMQTVQALQRLSERARPDVFVMDVASVKSRVAEAVVSGDFKGEYLSLHPMFGPVDDFSGRNVVALPLRDGSRCRAMIERLGKWGANVTEMTAERHDRATAWLQAGAHALLLAWMKSAIATGIDPATMLRIGTPISTALAALAARVLNADVDLYYNVQSANPFAAEMRRQLEESLAEMDRVVQSGDVDAFRETVSLLTRRLGEDCESLSNVAAKIVDVSRGNLKDNP